MAAAEIFVQILVLLASFSGLCVWNYRFSTWIFTTCGSSIWYFMPVFLFVLTTISTFIYMLSAYFSKLYLRRLLRTLDQSDLIEFSLLMSRFKERQCTQVTANSEHEQRCLVCYEYTARTITKPCGHQVMCGRCAWKYIATCVRDHVTFRCILCRTEVTEYNGDITVMMDKINLKELASITKSHSSATDTSNTLHLEPCSL